MMTMSRLTSEIMNLLSRLLCILQSVATATNTAGAEVSSVPQTPPTAVLYVNRFIVLHRTVFFSKTAAEY